MKQDTTTDRPDRREEELPAERRVRRMREMQPRGGRALPGMPLEMPDADADGEEHSAWGRGVFGRDDGPSGPWWRPASNIGRAFLALGALAVLGCLMVGVALLKSSLESDSRFRIAGSSNIQMVGLSEVSRSELLPVFGEDIGKNIFFVHLDERRRELEAIPWVAHATVMRVLPDQIRISVVERKPVAFTQIDGQTGLVDSDGVLLTMPAATMAERHYSFPAVTGLDTAGSADARKVRMAVYSHMIAELDANGQHNSMQISEVDLSDPEDARIRMADQGGDIVAHLGDSHFLDRYQRYMRHIGEWRQQYPHLSGVDLRYDRQVVLQMAQPGTDAPADAAPADPNAISPQNAVAAAPPAPAPAVKKAEVKKDAAATPKKQLAKKGEDPKKASTKKNAHEETLSAKKGAHETLKKSSRDEQKKLALKKDSREAQKKLAAKKDLSPAAKKQAVKAGVKPAKKGLSQAKTTSSGRAGAGRTTQLAKEKNPRKQGVAQNRQVQAKATQQNRRQIASHTAVSAPRHKSAPVVMRPVSPAVEGQ